MVAEKEICKHCKTPLSIRQTQRKASQLTKPYYYTAYFYCPSCKRIYHNDQFKVINKTMDLFTNKQLESKAYNVEIWTDGASFNNGRDNAQAAWAFVALIPQKSSTQTIYEESGLVEGKQTNNRGEAFAILHALKWAGEKGYKKVCIHTDSQITLYSLSTLAKNPLKIKANKDIFQQIANILERYQLDVDYVKVAGHSGDKYNERADQLAKSHILRTSL